MITYTLFRRRIKPPAQDANNGVTSFTWFDTPKEPWQQEPVKVIQGQDQPKDTLEFVCHVASPQEAAVIVRRDPLQEYLLFKGEVMKVQVQMPVFVDGKNLDTLQKEGWVE